MELIKVATQLLLNQLGGANSGLSENLISSALSNLLPSNSKGDLDLGSLVSQFNSGGLASMAASWLGDGENQAISGNQMTELLGQNKMNQFAQQLGIDEEQASTTLAKTIPELINSNSQSGTLLEAVTENDMLGSLAKGALGSFLK